MTAKTRILLALVAALLAACAAGPAPQPSLPPDLPNPQLAKGAFYIDLFADQRKDIDKGTTYFGEILWILRTERLHFAVPVSEVVRSTTITTLRSLGYRAERSPAASEARDPHAMVITGRIDSLHAFAEIWWGARLVYATVELCLDSGRWCRKISVADRRGPDDISANAMDLWMRKFLEDKLVAFFSSAEFAEALKETGDTGQSPAGR